MNQASCRLFPLQSDPFDAPEYIFVDVRRLRLTCFMSPDAARDDRHIVFIVDDGFTDIHFDINEDSSSVRMDVDISFVPGPEDTLFFFTPVLMTVAGQLYAVPGDFMTVNTAVNPPRSSVAQAILDERKHTENGSEAAVTTSITIQIHAVREPMEIHLLQFSEKRELLKNEAFLPGTVPNLIAPLAETTIFAWNLWKTMGTVPSSSDAQPSAGTWIT